MVTTVIISMLCVHLLCFAVMFVLISTKLHGRKMGMDVFALGSLMLGCAYLLQLFSGPPGPLDAISVINHTLTLCAPVVYLIGGIRFFNRPAPIWRPLLSVAVLYTVAQCALHWSLGPHARYAMLSGTCTLLFLVMSLAAVHGAFTFAKDLRMEMLLFAAFIGGICVLNALKFVRILSEGMDTLDMDSPLQIAFYLYMSFLGTVLPPSIVWLVLRRLTDELRTMAARDPLTRLLNRRGLYEALENWLRPGHACGVHLLILDIDHFKTINDTYGHKAGDLVLCHVAQLLRHLIRQDDLSCRLGGEEFVAVFRNLEDSEVQQLAERIRHAIEQSQATTIGLMQPLRCTVTIGISRSFDQLHSLERALQEADTALYRGKAAGRNRIVSADDRLHATAPLSATPGIFSGAIAPAPHASKG